MSKMIYITNTKDADINYIKDSNTITVFKGLNLVEVHHPANATQSAVFLKLLNHFDIFILSKSRRALVEAQEIFQYTRLVYEVKGVVKDINKLAKRIFSIRTFTVCLDPINANQELIRKLHFKGIKVIIRAYSQLDVYRAALSGADGVIGDNLERVEIKADLITLPFLVSYRGDYKDLPENSIASGKRAYESGANILEMDVHLTKDKKLVVHHAPSLGDHYTKDFVIKYNTLLELQVAKKKLDEKVLNETIETLEQFDKALPADLTFLIEAKVEGKDAIKELAKQVNQMKRNVMVMSFYPIALINMDSMMKKNINGLLLSKDSENMELLPLIKVVNKYKLIIHPHYDSENLEWENELKRRMIGYSPWGISRAELENALFENHDMINSEYIYELAHLPQRTITRKEINYKNGEVRNLKLFNEKGEKLSFEAHIIKDHAGLIIEGENIVGANNQGIAYLYLTHTTKVKKRNITYASDIIKVTVL